MYRRANAKWTVNECLRLEREFDLLKLTVQDIALLHERSPDAIMYKLEAEGIADYNDVFLTRQTTEAAIVEAEAEETLYEEDTEVSSENETYDLREQIKYLTKQVSNLTKFVYNKFTSQNSSSIKMQSLGGFR